MIEEKEQKKVINETMKMIEWTKEQSWRTYGESSAFTKCYMEFESMLENGILEIKLLLEAAPEPSNRERFGWEDATKKYVEMLELIVRTYIH